MNSKNNIGPGKTASFTDIPRSSLSQDSNTIKQPPLQQQQQQQQQQKQQQQQQQQSTRQPRITPLTDGPGAGTNASAQLNNVIDLITQYLNPQHLHQLTSKFSAFLQDWSVVQDYYAKARDAYTTNFGEDVRPLYAVVCLLSLLFFFFILQPLLVVFRFAVFGFVCYSCYYTLMDSSINQNEKMVPFLKLGLFLLAAYLFKYLM